MQSKTVCVMGLGYIGLPTAALLANRKYQVHGVDVVQSTVDTINQGKIHIVEPELDVFVKSILLKPKDISVQRVTAGIDDNSLIAPSWCRDKNMQIKHINQALKPLGLKY